MRLLKVITVGMILCMETVVSAPKELRLSIAEPMPSYYYTDIGGDSGAYAFGYDVWDPATDNKQFRNEERYPNGTVVGNYGYVDALGKTWVFKYVADERGYRVRSEDKIRQQSSVNTNQEETSTESSVTWTRPSKKTPQQNKGNILQRRKYTDVQAPGYYLLY